MENYQAEPVIEHHSDPVPFDIENDPSCFLIRLEERNTRVKTLVNRALKNFGNGKKIVFIAQGRATAKAVSCVEIVKTYYKKPIYQITRINQIRTIETWYPLMEGLDPIVVTRALPVLYILISQESLRSDEDGFQVYNHREPKKVLNLQLAEENENKQMEAAENLNNSSMTSASDLENRSELSQELTQLNISSISNDKD